MAEPPEGMDDQPPTLRGMIEPPEDLDEAAFWSNAEAEDVDYWMPQVGKMKNEMMTKFVSRLLTVKAKKTGTASYVSRMVTGSFLVPVIVFSPCVLYIMRFVSSLISYSFG